MADRLDSNDGTTAREITADPLTVLQDAVRVAVRQHPVIVAAEAWYHASDYRSDAVADALALAVEAYRAG